MMAPSVRLVIGAIVVVGMLSSGGCVPEAAPVGAAASPRPSTVDDDPNAVNGEPPVGGDEPANVANEPLAPTPASDASTRQVGRAGHDWPHFLGPHRDSKSAERGLISPWPAEGPRIVWQRPLGVGYGIGSVADGRYFQFDRVDDEAVLFALDARTGDELWRFAYPTRYVDLYGYNSGPRCSPVVDGERVYIFGVEGMLHCLAAATGELLWKVDTQRQFGVVQNFFGVGSNPIVEGDLLIVMVGGSPPASRNVPPGALDRVEGDGSAIVAFDKQTGDVRYRISDELASYASLTAATIAGRRWCFAFCRGGLLVFEPAAGAIDFFYPWRDRSLESVNASTPIVVGDEVLISETYGPGSSLLRVRPGGYEIVWRDDPRVRDKALQTHWMTPIYVDGNVYGSSGRHEYNAELRCVEWSTGRVLWSEPHLTRASLLHVDGHFICLTEDGVLRLLRVNPEKYDLVSEAQLRDTTVAPSVPGLAPRRLLRPPAWAAPILAHGLLYVRGDDRLVCLEAIAPE